MYPIIDESRFVRLKYTPSKALASAVGCPVRRASDHSSAASRITAVPKGPESRIIIRIMETRDDPRADLHLN
jgi:hypothetical protein